MDVNILTSGGGDEDAGRQRLILDLSSLAHSLAGEETARGFQTALDFVEALLNVDASHLVLRELNGESLASVASSHIPPPAGSSSPCVGEGLARAAMETSEVLCIEDLASESRDGLGSLASAGFSSSLCAPILIGENPAGAVIAASVAPRTFTVADMELLWEICKAIAESLLSRGPGWVILPSHENSAEVAEAQRRMGDMKFFNRLSDAIISASSLQGLADSALEISMHALDAGIGSLMLLDYKTQQLTVQAARGLPNNLVKSMAQPVGEGVAGWVAQHQKPLLLERIQEDYRFRALHSRPEIACSLSIPLRTRDRLIGVMNLARVIGQPSFRQEQAELLETVANQLAIAIERMRLHQEMKKRSLQLTTLMEIGKTITSMLDLGVVSEQIAVQTRNLVRAERTFLFYYDPMNDRVRFGAQSGCDAATQDALMPCARDLALAAARNNRLTTGAETQAHAGRARRGQSGSRRGVGEHWFAVPFRQRGHRIGVAVVVPMQGVEADPDAPELLEQFGSLAGVAIQNARTYNRQRAIASVIQESMLTTGPVDFPGVEIAHRLIPEHEIGGDYYDFIPLEDGKLGVVMADVSGSSVRAAAYTLVGKHALRAYAHEYPCPAEVLRRLNHMICAESDVEIFISVFYGIIDTAAHRLTYAMAGHEPPVLLRGATRNTELLKADGLLVGVEPDVAFERRTHTFRPGDMLMLYTDGLTDAPFRGRRFGLKRLRDFLRRSAERPVQDIVDGMVTSRMRFSQNRITDDMSLVLIRAGQH